MSPAEVLPDAIKQFVTVAAKAIGCDASYVGLPMLAMLAACIGTSRVIRLKHSWREPCIVWSAIVGESGTLKTPAFRSVMQPLRDAQSKALQRHAEAESQYETELAEYEQAMTTWKKQGKTGEQPTKPQPPTCTRFIVSDTTVEAMAPILLANPRGLLMARDELSGWIGSFDGYKAAKGADAAHWLSSHGGESIIVDRKTGTPRTIYVPRASVGVAGGIQPGILRRALGVEHRESGLAARLLMAMPPRTPKRWTDADIPQHVEDGLARLVEQLLDLQPGYNADGEPYPLAVDLTPEAKRLWVKHYNAHAVEQAELSGDLAAAWSKLEGYAARLALVVHCVRRVSGDSGEAVDEPSIQAGITLAKWFGNEAKRIYGVLDESDDSRESRELIDWIKRKGGSVTARDMTRGPRAYRGDSQAAQAALDELAKAGLGNWEYAPVSASGGPPKRRFVLATQPPAKTPATVATVPQPPTTGPKTGVMSPSPVSPPENGEVLSPTDSARESEARL